MKVWNFFQRIIVNITCGMLTALSGTGSALAGDSREKSKLEKEFEGEPPLPQETIEIYKQADLFYDQAKESGDNRYYIKAIQHYDKLYDVQWQGGHINLLAESISVIEGKSKALEALGYKEQSTALKKRLEELKSSNQD